MKAEKRPAPPIPNREDLLQRVGLMVLVLVTSLLQVSDQQAMYLALVALIATQSSQVLNTSALSRVLGLPNTTLKRYLALVDDDLMQAHRQHGSVDNLFRI